MVLMVHRVIQIPTGHGLDGHMGCPLPGKVTFLWLVVVGVVSNSGVYWPSARQPSIHTVMVRTEVSDICTGPWKFGELRSEIPRDSTRPDSYPFIGHTC